VTSAQHGLLQVHGRRCRRRSTDCCKSTVAAVVGNEDGAHHISAILFQALNDVGFTLPAHAVTYWNDEAMP